MAEEKKSKKEKALEVFQALDSDGNGILTHDQLGEAIYESRLGSVIKRLDPKGRGSITFIKFLDGFDATIGEDDDPDENVSATLFGAEIKMDVIQQKVDERSSRFSTGFNDNVDDGDGDDEDEDEDLARIGKFIKLFGWMKDSDQMVGASEVDKTIQCVCKRGFTPNEHKAMKNMFLTKGFVTVKLSAIATCLEEAKKEEEKNKDEWDDDRFIKTFLDKVDKGISINISGLADTTQVDTVASLTQKVQLLKEKHALLRANRDSAKLKAAKLDDENQDLRDKDGGSHKGRRRTEQLEKDRVKQLKIFESMVDQLQASTSKLERELRNLTQEHQNDLALLKVKETMIKNTNADLYNLKKRMDGLLQSHAARYRFELKKKCGKMTAIEARRRYIRELQVDNERISQLEVQNDRLKQAVDELREQAQEYLKAMSSLRENKIRGRSICPPPDVSTVRFGIVLADEEELEELKKKLKIKLAENVDLEKEVEEHLIVLEEEKKARIIAEEKVKDLEEQVNELTIEVDALTAKINKLEGDLEAEKAARLQEVQALEAKIVELEQRIRDLEKQLAEEIAAKEALQQQLAALGDDSEAKILEMIQLIADLKKRIKELEEQLDIEKRQREDLERDLVVEKDMLEYERTEIKKLEEELEEKKKALEDAKARIIELEEILKTKQCEVVSIDESKVIIIALPVVEDLGVKLTPDQQAELSAYARCFNKQLGEDDDLKYLMPINEQSPELLSKLKDGMLIAKYINLCVAETIDTRALNMEQGAMSTDLMHENLTLCIASAKAIGIPIANEEKLIEELLEPSDPIMLLTFLFNLIKSKYFQHVNVQQHPELMDICENPSTGLSGLNIEELEPDHLQSLHPDALLLRWLNWQRIAEAHSTLESICKSWGDDLCDAKAYSSILSRVAECKGDASAMPDNSKTDGKRAKHVIEKATYLGIEHFHQPENITGGSDRLNLLLSACIFCHHTAISDEDDWDDQEKGKAKKDTGGSWGDGLTDEQREERVYRMWINSCAIPNVFVNNLFLDVRDGLKLLKLIDHIHPGAVKWKKVAKKPKGKFQKVANGNYIIKLCKKPLGLKIKLIGGEDIAGGNPKLIMAVVNNLMRYDIMNKLGKAFEQLGAKRGDEEKAILKWVNDTISAHQHKLNGTRKVKHFKDKKLSDSLVFFNLLWVIQPKLIKWKMVNTDCQSLQEKSRNAGYVISVARKMGAEIFCLPHDIVRVNHSQVLLFVGQIMLIALKNK